MAKRNTKMDAAMAVPALRPFISSRQLEVIGMNCYREERQFFIDKLVELAGVVKSMPKVYEQDGLGNKAVAHLHYFVGGVDAYITERDTSEEQHQAFGIINIGYGFEMGYISIQELIDNGAELDLYFDPIPLYKVTQ